MLAGGPLRRVVAQVPPTGHGQRGELHLTRRLDHGEMSGVAAWTTVVLRPAVMMRMKFEAGRRLNREREKNQDH